MKEAAGEANLTVVAIILIGVVVAVVTPLINSMMKNTANKACCTDAGGFVKGNNCIIYEGGSQTSVDIKSLVNESGECQYNK